MRRAALLPLTAALALAGCGGSSTPEPAAAPAATATKAAPARDANEVVDVHNVLDLRAAFVADRGKTRLLVLLSPT